MIRIQAARKHRKTADRVDQVADQLGQLAARTLGGRLPDVQLLVTDSREMIRVVCQAEIDLAGVTSRPRRSHHKAAAWWHNRHVYGATTYDRGRILVAINAPENRGDLELRRTLIHELGHAVQMNDPRLRRDMATYTRMQLGTLPRDPRVVADYERGLDTRERQAAKLEALAR